MRHQSSAAGRPTTRPDDRPAEQAAGVPRFTARFSSTRRGARLARRLAVQQFAEWTGLPHGCDAAHAVALVTAELAANAVTHGSLPGRDFRLTLLLSHEPAVHEPVPHEPAAMRIEVTDTRPERLPRHPAADPGPPDEVSGRGLLLVAVYARRWGCEVRDAFTKTVWAEVPLRQPSAFPTPHAGQASAQAVGRSDEV
ncbi:ATP-binding protein [Streptomyces radiopugnans]|uniref:Histidine kinase-like ATPase domain-containing protein n=1 Tax=Streptomyces radiopugnans TaxID=403935 RepID=A0A1H9G7A1_9ACTN|nr:ATP-binding protein [Streptomyces radiopugnans]SEQ46045.1 Histidine kinase-like ATPase domain-containing protein [Streptomyces radiopugnans]